MDEPQDDGRRRLHQSRNRQRQQQRTTLPPGATTVVPRRPRITAARQQPTATKTLGVYAQEQASFRDRLFLTVAARSDQNSAFGTNFQRVVYPKASLSWLVSDESFFPKYDWLNQFRLRSVVRRERRAAGPHVGSRHLRRRAPSRSTRRSSTTGHATRLALIASNPGNAEPQARAVRRSSRLDSRRRCSTTACTSTTRTIDKTTHDALISVPIAGSAGAAGDAACCRTSARRGTPATKSSSTRSSSTSRDFGWDVTLTGSHNTGDRRRPRHRSVDRDGARHRRRPAHREPQRRSDQQPVVSPVHVRRRQPRRHPAASPKCTSIRRSRTSATAIPRDLFSVQNGLRSLQAHGCASTSLFDYKGGYSTQDGANNFQCNSPPFSPAGRRRIRTAPLALQARAIAKTYGTTIGGDVVSRRAPATS